MRPLSQRAEARLVVPGIIAVIAAGLVVACVDCGRENRARYERRRHARIRQEATDSLPPGATDIDYQGDGWVAFTQRVDGEPRRFLSRHRKRHSRVPIAVWTNLTELSPAATQPTKETPDGKDTSD